ncbi:MAG: hypothetical protein ABIH11_05405 [Candidatus Altiarchaeota archaeon]
MSLRVLGSEKVSDDTWKIVLAVLLVLVILFVGFMIFSFGLYSTGIFSLLSTASTTSSSTTTSTTTTSTTSSTTTSTTTTSSSTTTSMVSTTTTYASTTTLDPLYTEAFCVSQRITALYMHDTDAGSRCPQCRAIKQHYGNYFSLFDSTIRYCISDEDNEECIDELQEYQDDDDMIDAQTGEEYTGGIGYPAAVIAGNAYVRITPSNLKSITVC